MVFCLTIVVFIHGWITAFLHPVRLPLYSSCCCILVSGQLFTLFCSDDLWPAWEREKAADDAEPEWVAQEREQFFKHRDKDLDKRLDRVSKKKMVGRVSMKSTKP